MHAEHLVVRYQLDLAIMSGHSGGVGGARVDHQPSGAAVSEGGQQGVLDEEEGRHVVLLEH